MGGIGDQIFQICFGLTLMKKFNSNLFLDTNYYNSKLNYNKFKFYLDLSEIKPDIKKGEKFYIIKYSKLSYVRFLDFLKKLNLNFIYKYLLNKIFTKRISSFIYEYKNLSSQEIYKSNSYYYGYWHDFKNVKEFKNIIIKYLKNKYFVSNKILNFSKKISDKTVAIHIRGGDFKSVSSHNTLEYQYYNKAIVKIIRHLKSPKFHIYTNDISHAKTIIGNINVKIDIMYIYKYKFSPIEEFCLFSKYKYAIIANSTFSLMSSYLSDKRVFSYGPLIWMKNKKINQKKKFKKLYFI